MDHILFYEREYPLANDLLIKKYMIKYSIATFGTIILTCAYFSLVTAVFAIIKKGILG